VDDPLIGRAIKHYRLVRLLGRGGMASVYLARDEKLQREVAVKLIPAVQLGDEIMRARFEQEALATARLDHPNIVHIYDYGQESDLAYMVMEYLPGGSLYDQLRESRNQHRVLGTGPILTALIQVAHGLDHAHRSGIIHRDVKPGNVLFARDGRAVLTDLGIAKALTGPKLTRTMTTVGTPEYISPEQGRGDRVDHRSDLYSLGVVMYELLTGVLPYQADTPWGIVFKHISEPLPPIETIDPTVSPALRSVVEKALAKAPDDRFQTGQEMADAIRQAMATPTRPLFVRPISRPPAPAPAPKIRPPTSTADAETVVQPVAGVTVRPAGRGRPKVALWAPVGVMAAAALLVLGLARPWTSSAPGDPSATPFPTGPSVAQAGGLPPSPTAAQTTAAGVTTPEGAAPTLAPTAVATGTLTPSPTAQPSETPTAPATPTPTATAPPTPTTTPMSTRTPQATSTRTAIPTRPPPLIAPQALEPIGGADQFGQTTLRWTAVPGAQRYLIQTRSGLQGQEEWGSWFAVHGSTEYTIHFEGDPAYFRQPGTVYEWRVLAVDALGNRGQPSNVGSFKIQWKKPETGDF
jgi:serine/threonine-protein kinase